MIHELKYPETEEELLRKAEQGDADAQVRIAFCYCLGSPVIFQDKGKYIEWTAMAAEQGNPEALFNFGACYLNGSSGLAKDERKGQELFNAGFEAYRKQAEQGEAHAQVELGLCYSSGSGVDMDKKKGFDLYVKAARQGYARAMRMIAWAYYNSYQWGEEAGDKEKEIEWHMKAAENGDADAQIHVGGIYSFVGLDGLPKDVEKAIGWYAKAAEQNHAKAQLKLAECYLAKEPGKAFSWFTMAAEEHWNVYAGTYARAQMGLGKCYMGGIGVVKDERKAWEWITKAAANGNGVAKLHLEDLAKAERGDAEAQYIFATRFLNKMDFAEDKEKALEWLGRAAAQGNTRAIKMIKTIKSGKAIKAF